MSSNFFQIKINILGLHPLFYIGGLSYLPGVEVCYLVMIGICVHEPVYVPYVG